MENGTLGIAQTDIGREIERIYAQINGVGGGEPAPTATPDETTNDPYQHLSEDDRNWLKWREFIQQDPNTALTHLAQAFGVNPPHTPNAPPEPEEEENPLDYLDDYTKRAVEKLIAQQLQPYLEQLQTLAAAAQLFYAEQLQHAAAQQIRQLHQPDAPLIGELNENDIQDILRIAAEKFNWNLEDAYTFWVAPKLRARQKQQTQPREYQPIKIGEATPGDILRALKAERGGE